MTVSAEVHAKDEILEFLDEMFPEAVDSGWELLARLERQLRVLGLIIHASGKSPLQQIPNPGSISGWLRVLDSPTPLHCDECRATVQAVSSAFELPVGEQRVVDVRNTMFHGGPTLENLVETLAPKVHEITALLIQMVHHLGDGFEAKWFRRRDGRWYVFNRFDGRFATFWPSSGTPIDIPATTEEFPSRLLRVSDSPASELATTVTRDLRGFAEGDSLNVLYDEESLEVVASWRLATTTGGTDRVDRFIVGKDRARRWMKQGVPSPYTDIFLDIVHLPILRKRLWESTRATMAAEDALRENLVGRVRFDQRIRARVFSGRKHLNEQAEHDFVDWVLKTTRRNQLLFTEETSVVVLTGDAGSGKTHALLDLLQDLLNLPESEASAPIPVYVSSSAVSATSLKQAVEAVLPSTRILDWESLLALCRYGLAFIVVDGLDEMVGFRRYDDPMTGLQPFLDGLRGSGILLVSARSAYYDAFFRLKVELGAAAQRFRPSISELRVLPWGQKEQRSLFDANSIDSASVSPEDMRLVVTPFFALSFVRWHNLGRTNGSFVESMMRGYLEREQGKVRGSTGKLLYTVDQLEAIFENLAEYASESNWAEVSTEVLEMVAQLALGEKLSDERRKRLSALCGVTAAWHEEERAFRFSHPAVGEYFLASQLGRLDDETLGSRLSKFDVGSALADLLARRMGEADWPNRFRSLLRVHGSGPKSPRTRANFGKIWTKLALESDSAPPAIDVNLLELNLPQGHFQFQGTNIGFVRLSSGSSISLASSQLDQLDVRGSQAFQVRVDPTSIVGEVICDGRVIEKASEVGSFLGLSDGGSGSGPAIESLSQRFFISKLRQLGGKPIIVESNDYVPDAAEFRWTRKFGDRVWSEFVRREIADGNLDTTPLATGGTRKCRLFATSKLLSELLQ